MSVPQTTLADFGGDGQTSLTVVDEDDIPTRFDDDGIPRRVGRYTVGDAKQHDVVAQWDHDSGLRSIAVMRVRGAGETVFEIHRINDHEDRTSTEYIDEQPTETSAIARAVAFLE